MSWCMLIGAGLVLLFLGLSVLGWFLERAEGDGYPAEALDATVGDPTPTALRAAVEAILQHEEGYARDASSRAGWGPVGVWVGIAASGARRAIETVNSAQEGQAWLEEAISAVERARVEARGSYEDEDGYISATFKEIVRKLEALRPFARKVGDMGAPDTAPSSHILPS